MLDKQRREFPFFNSGRMCGFMDINIEKLMQLKAFHSEQFKRRVTSMCKSVVLRNGKLLTNWLDSIKDYFKRLVCRLIFMDFLAFSWIFLHFHDFSWSIFDIDIDIWWIYYMRFCLSRFSLLILHSQFSSAWWNHNFSLFNFMTSWFTFQWRCL